MYKINVMELIGNPSAITQEDGDKVYDEIIKAINEKQQIELDFKDIESMISPFLNNAIGKLYKSFSGQEIKEYLKIINVPEGKISTINMVINNAKRYYSNEEKYNKKVKDMME